MPKVEANRPVRQALLARLYSKGLRLAVVPDEDEKADRPASMGKAEQIAVKRAKGSKATLNETERILIGDHHAQLLHMVRYDHEYGKELIRGVHQALSKAYPIGRGCELTEAMESIQRATERLHSGDMHGLWAHLDQALVTGLQKCEEYRGMPLLPEAAPRSSAEEEMPSIRGRR